MPMNRMHPHLSKGYAYVEYETSEEAEKALKHMDGGRKDWRDCFRATFWVMCLKWINSHADIFQVRSMVRKSLSQLCWLPRCAPLLAGFPLPGGCLLRPRCGAGLHLVWGEGNEQMMGTHSGEGGGGERKPLPLLLFMFFSLNFSFSRSRSPRRRSPVRRRSRSPGRRRHRSRSSSNSSR